MPDISGYIWERVNVGCQSKDDIRITWATCQILRLVAYISGANVGLGWISCMYMYTSVVGYLWPTIELSSWLAALQIGLPRYKAGFLVACIVNWVNLL